MLAAFALVMGCSEGGAEDATISSTTTTATTTTSGPLPCDFKVGDRITADGIASRGPCLMTFLCADGRLHVTADLANGKRLEGFAPTDQSGKPRADTSDAVWQEDGGDYQGLGRTKLQFDCGG